MKFGQLIKHNIKNMFFEKSYAKRCGESIPRPFSKRSKLIISMDLKSEVLYSLFLLYAKFSAMETYWN